MPAQCIHVHKYKVVGGGSHCLAATSLQFDATPELSINTISSPLLGHTTHSEEKGNFQLKPSMQVAKGIQLQLLCSNLHQSTGHDPFR